MAAPHITREEERLKDQEIFRRNALVIIDEMVELLNEPEAPAQLVDEVLHSIFFMGKINKPPYTPEIIFVNDEEMLKELKESFPRPFDLYSSQLPRRCPFSCVLEMIVQVSGAKNEDDIKEKLQQLNQELSSGYKARCLISSTLCVSQSTDTPDAVRYYGVSMSTSGGVPGQIMVAASCFSFSDSYVADAVMTYYPNKFKKNDFDGTIRLPDTVRCQAFSISRGVEMPPCISCGDLFGLHTTENLQFSYGNCAEVQSVSNMFKKEREIREQARPQSALYTDVSRQKARRSALKRLTSLLSEVGFLWDNRFYPNIEFNPKRAEVVTVEN